MIVTVTPNPAVDMTYHAESITLGVSHRLPAAYSRAGGKGINVARVCHQLGHSTLALATVGGDTGTEFSRELIASGVPHHFIQVSSIMRRSIALVEARDGRTTVLNEIGNPLTESEWAKFGEAVRLRVPKASCLVGSGSLPGSGTTSSGTIGAATSSAVTSSAHRAAAIGLETDSATRDGFYAFCVQTAHDVGVPAIIDATGKALLLAAGAGADVLKPNQSELKEATGLTDPVAGSAHLLDLGAKMVLVSLGEDGMFAVSSDDRKPLFARLPVPLIGNPTGAGDAAVAAVAVCLSTGSSDIETILRRATGWSAAAVLAPVAGDLADDVTAIEAEVVISR